MIIMKDFQLALSTPTALIYYGDNIDSAMAEGLRLKSEKIPALLLLVEVSNLHTPNVVRTIYDFNSIL